MTPIRWAADVCHHSGSSTASWVKAPLSPWRFQRATRPLIEGQRIQVPQPKLDLVVHRALAPPHPVVGQPGPVIGMQQRGQRGIHLVRVPVQNLPVGFIDENHLAGR